MNGLLVAALLPVVFWDRGTDTISLLQEARIPCIAVPPDAAEHWATTGFCAHPASLAEREKLPPPGIRMRTRGAGTASATVAPWVDSNGWRFQFRPDSRFLYEVPAGRAQLAAAEAFAFDADAVLRIADEDLRPFGDLLAFLQSLPRAERMKAVSNIAVVNNHSPLLPEALNLLTRRNLLFRIVDAPDPSADLNIEIGSKLFPQSESTNPVYVAERARELLTDRKRLLRIYGSENVLGRLTQGSNLARLHLLNYSPRKAEALRIRVKGTFKDIRLHAFGYSNAEVADIVHRAGGTEFTVHEMGPYAVVDLGGTVSPSR
jgi:hypothetical protein